MRRGHDGRIACGGDECGNWVHLRGKRVSAKSAAGSDVSGLLWGTAAAAYRHGTCHRERIHGPADLALLWTLSGSAGRPWHPTLHSTGYVLDHSSAERWQSGDVQAQERYLCYAHDGACRVMRLSPCKTRSRSASVGMRPPRSGAGTAAPRRTPRTLTACGRGLGGPTGHPAMVERPRRC